MSKAYTQLLEELREIATLSSVSSLLGWDQETMMPTKGAGARAEAMALTGRITHEKFISEQIGDLIGECETDVGLLGDPAVSANLRELRRDYERARRIPPDLVAETQATSAYSQLAWRQAREDDAFEIFRPWLEKQIDLSRRRAECYGTPPGGEIYDALLEDYEPGMTVAKLASIFEPLRAELTALIAEIASASYRPNDAPLRLRVPIPRQQIFHRTVLDRLGFDPEAGRLDISTHPFSSGIAPGDTRITSRYREDGFADALGSTMHEAGHALYEQGLPKMEYWGQPLGEPAGQGIHESQSRLWENQVGRSMAFWTWALPVAKDTLGSVLEPYSVAQIYEALNIVRPHLIRVESDEATYNLHVMLRFDLERAMLSGDLSPQDLPGAWNERIRFDLDLEVPDDTRGCLQDIHWSKGSVGYFPTYTLGNLYAAQLYETVLEQEPNIEAQFASGEFSTLLRWLRTRIHANGRRLTAADLCRAVTGRGLSHEPLMRHLRGKLFPIYRLES